MFLDSDISANNVLVKHIRIVNSAGPNGGQAVALRVAGDNIAVYQCSIQGYQDTLLTAYGQHFFRECEIYGTVDFIFGFSRVVFQNCMIYVRRRTEGNVNMITAQGRGDPENTGGTVLHNCTIKADRELEPYLNQFKTFLGRPWYDYSQTIVMQSFLDNLIDPEGWLEGSDEKSMSTVHYVEYDNRGPGANTKGRVQWPGYHVANNSEELNHFTVENFINGTLWLPNLGIPFIPGFI